MIDFKCTFDDKDKINFCNEDGEVVKSHLISQLEDYVISNNLNVITISANGFVSIDPDIIEKEIITPVSKYIDDNWFILTEQFYSHVNTQRKN